MANDKTIFNQGHRPFSYKDPKTGKQTFLNSGTIVTLPAAEADKLLVYKEIVDTASQKKNKDSQANSVDQIKAIQSKVEELEKKLADTIKELEAEKKKSAELGEDLAKTLKELEAEKKKSKK